MDALFALPWGPLLIFCLRVADVSMSMLRMILAVRGHRFAAAAIGFFEVFLWLFAVGNALKHLDSMWHLIGYAGGFATGNYVGVWLEGRLAFGINVVRAVFSGPESRRAGETAAGRLRGQGFAVTEIEGRGRETPVEILNVVVQRRDVPEVVRLVHDVDKAAFVSIEEVRSMRGGYVRPGGRKMPFLTHS